MVEVELAVVQLLHYIGTAFGLGGVTTTTLIVLQGKKNPEIAPHMMTINHVIMKLIWTGIFLVIISGVAYPYVMPSTWNYEYTTIMMVKHVLVALLILNGLLITFGIAPKLTKNMPKKDEKPTATFIKAKKRMGASLMLGLTLWYLIVILSVVN